MKRNFKQLLLSNFTAKNDKYIPSRQDSEKKIYEEHVEELLAKAKTAFQKKIDNTSHKNNDGPKNVSFRKYKKYTKEEKEAILALTPHKTLASIEKEFGVDEATLRGWRDRSNLEDKRKNNSRPVVLETVEDKLALQLTTIRTDGVPLTGNLIIQEMKNLFCKEFNLKDSDFVFLQQWLKYTLFKGLKSDCVLKTQFSEVWYSFDENNQEYELSLEQKIRLRDFVIQTENKIILIDNDWLSRFTNRKNFTYKKLTHKNPKSFMELQGEIIDFVERIHELRSRWNIPVDLIINVDETALYFDQIPTYSYEIKRVKHPHIKIANSYKKRITACLGVSGSGEKLNTILIFKGKEKGKTMRKLNNHQNYILYKNSNAWMKREIFKDYLLYSVKRWEF